MASSHEATSPAGGGRASCTGSGVDATAGGTWNRSSKRRNCLRRSVKAASGSEARAAGVQVQERRVASAASD
eukprot:4885969-Alexandrium_andersonii.AAC.1